MGKTPMELRIEELADNPSARVPVCLVLDTSASMNGEKILELNRAIASFYQAVLSDECARDAAEAAIVTFGGRVEKVVDFSSMARQRVPQLRPEGMTPMGGAVNLALDLLEQVKRVYSTQGVDYYQPWMVLMTDGEATDDIRDAVSRCRDLLERRKLTVFPVAIGQNANIAKLGEFAPGLKPLRIQSLDFGRFFAWLAKSISVASASNPGDRASRDLGKYAWERYEVMSYDDAFKRA